MMQCNKTGLTDKDWKTILDVLNVYDPNDIAHVYPEMGSPEFVQDVTNAFKKVLAHVNTNKYGSSLMPGVGPVHSLSDEEVNAEGYESL